MFKNLFYSFYLKDQHIRKKLHFLKEVVGFISRHNSLAKYKVLDCVLDIIEGYELISPEA